MLRNRRLLGLLGIVVLLVVLAVVWLNRPVPAYTTLVDPPAAVRAHNLETLKQAGHDVLGQPVWAGLKAGWRTPATYRVFFAASSAEGGADLYSADVQLDSAGRAKSAPRVTRLTETAAGDETPPVAAGAWLAYATRVGGYYQSVTCLRLGAVRQPEVYALTRPEALLALAWKAPAEAGSSMLEVRIGEPASGKVLLIDPAAHSVQPADGALAYTPAKRGEQAWLPNLVSRVRELPGVGPEKIAFLENLVFTITDKVTRLFHGRPAAATPQVAEVLPANTPTLEAATLPAQPIAVSPTPAATATPAPTATPVGKPLADGIVWRGSVQPDQQRPYAQAEIIDIDPAVLQLKMIPGTWEPRPSTGLVGSGVIPAADWPALVAGFNGGFAAMHGSYGMMVDRKVYLPAREGIATVAVYEDGSMRLGTWGKDLSQTPDMVSYRQNCPPLVEDGKITAETGKLTLWGLSVSNEVYLYRSGLGVRPDGHLVYVAGKSLSAYTLAQALLAAGAQYGMQLDVDEFHVAFITYDVQPGQGGGAPNVVGHKLKEDMRGFDGLFLRPFQLDFFYLTRRAQPLQQAVRVSPTLLPVSAMPTPARLDLPGKLAFASLRDGNWELYSMAPGDPTSVRRLTNSPADDLYPAWARDGSFLAFSSRRDGNLEVYTLDPATGGTRRVTTQVSEEWAPSLSPDGKQIVYQSDRNGQSDIYRSAIDGSGETRLTPHEGNFEAPDWSADGQIIIFDSDFDVAEAVSASINLYTMAPDGSNARRITPNGESPRLAPDGRQVAFTSRRTGSWQIFLINTDGSGYRQLTTGVDDARYPAWSPDGKWLAFASNQDGHWEIYVVPVEGGQPTRLTFGTTDSSYPAWGK